jgi:putative oxidoreductase
MSIVLRTARWLDTIPYSVVALFPRAATFSVFFRAGTQKLSDWNTTLLLFQNEYHVPVLPSSVAAHMAVCIELGCSSLVLIGLLTRASVALLLGMVLVIQLCVYPMAWPDHLQWLAFMFILLARGPGKFSMDAVFSHDRTVHSHS